MRDTYDGTVNFSKNRSLYRESCFSSFSVFKIFNIRNFPTLLNSYHENTSGKSKDLIVMIVTKCEIFYIALRR